MHHKVYFEKICFSLFIFILILWPFTNLIYNYFPINVYEKNLYSLICFFISYLIIFLILLINFKKNILFIITLVSFTLIFFLNLLIHDTNNKFQYISQYEIALTLLVFCVIACSLISYKNLNITSNIIIFACVTQAIFSLLNVNLNYGEFTSFFNYQSEYRQSGFLLNANLFSSFLSTGFILNLHRKYFFFNSEIYNKILKIIFILIFAIAIYFTESRLHIYFLIFYFILFIINNLITPFEFKLKYSLIFLLIPFILIFLFFLFLYQMEFLNHRIAIGLTDNIRLIKYYLGIKTILNDTLSLFVGMDRELFSFFRILNTRLSDNSIIYLIMYVGLPYTCFFLLVCCNYLIKNIQVNLLSFFLLGSFFLNLLLTGAIFWHVYLLYFAVVYILVFRANLSR